MPELPSHICHCGAKGNSYSYGNGKDHIVVVVYVKNAGESGKIILHCPFCHRKNAHSQPPKKFEARAKTIVV